MIPIPAIPVPPRALVIGIGILLVALIGLGAGVWLAAGHYEPKLEKANNALGEFKHAYATLATATVRQNDEIERMRDEAEKRKAKAMADAKAAKEAAGVYYGNSRAILSLVPAPGADLCRAAREEFDAALVIERGGL